MEIVEDLGLFCQDIKYKYTHIHPNEQFLVAYAQTVLSVITLLFHINES